MSGLCSMKRLTLASTTWGSNAQPEKRTTVSAPARRAPRTAPRPSPAPASAAVRRTLRRESCGWRSVRWLMTIPLLSRAVGGLPGASPLDRARHETLDDQPLEDEREHERRDDGQHAP